MPVFLVKKRQTGGDAHGDSFSWQPEEWHVLAASHEEMVATLALVNYVEVYANEYLALELVGPVEVEGERRAYSMRDQLKGYYVPQSLLDKLP